MATGAIHVQGLAELQRDFRRMSKELVGDLRRELKDAAEPVKKLGESLALGEIRNMPSSPRWAGMRIGVSGQAIVYMVPSARSRRRRGGARPNLAPLLLDRAMEPALERNSGQILARVDRMLGRLGGEYGF
jgi:hypothetical protein